MQQICMHTMQMASQRSIYVIYLSFITLSYRNKSKFVQIVQIEIIRILSSHYIEYIDRVTFIRTNLKSFQMQKARDCEEKIRGRLS